MGWQQNPSTGESYWVDDGQQPDAYGNGGSPAPAKRGGGANMIGSVLGGVKNAAGGLADLAARGVTGGDPSQYRAPVNNTYQNYGQKPLSTAQYGVTGGKTAPQLTNGMDRTPTNNNPMQAPGNNLTNPGYGEQAFEYTQNRLLEDPYGDFLNQSAQGTRDASQGENYMNQNLGSLDGPGQGEQYWNQVQGQFNDPFAGEQFARQATQNMSAQGPASAFYNQSMGQYDQFTGYTGPQNAQGQYGQSSASLAGGSQGEQGLGQLAGQYGAIGQYNGANNALGQYQQNAASGPMAAQSFYDSVQGQMGTKGTYSDPNLSAGQYAQTQGAFGDMPIANFDPFYDRARQLATQDYNRQSAGRGVYGSSEALSGVGNVITDIEAQRANRSFDAEMQRAQEQRMRQQLLGEQARMGDLSSLGAFSANLEGLNTFGNLANQAGNQTLNQQTMLGNQARQSDLSATDAFDANLRGVDTFANVNNMQATQELNRNELLGRMANDADTQALGAQNANIAGLNAFGDIASSADSAETNRYTATTNAMNNADRTALDRLGMGADIAFRGDDSARADYETSNRVANDAAQLGMDRTRLGADIANTASRNDLERLDSFNSTAQGAEGQRQARQIAKIESVASMSRDLQNLVSQGLSSVIGGSQADYENWFESEMLPALQRAGYDQQRIDGLRSDIGTGLGFAGDLAAGGGGAPAKPAAPAKKKG